MTGPVSFTVHGEPAPQGSKTRTRWGVREDNPRTKPWRGTVAAAAADAMAGREPLHGPCRLTVRFYFRRPQGHYGTGRNATVLKPSAPVWHAKKPDADKLARAIGDSLSGSVVRDDSQFAQVLVWKLYGAPERAEIEVQPIVAAEAAERQVA